MGRGRWGGEDGEGKMGRGGGRRSGRGRMQSELQMAGAGDVEKGKCGRNNKRTRVMEMEGEDGGTEGGGEEGTGRVSHTE